MASKLEIRPANVYDMHQLEILLYKGIEESKGLLPPYDVFQVYHHALKLIEIGSVYILQDIDEEKKQRTVVGCLMLDATSFKWNDAVKWLESVHFYVLPEWRAKKLPDGKLPFEALVDAAKGLAEACAMPLKIESFHQAGDNRVLAKDTLFEKAGFFYIGGNFAYLPKSMQQKEAAAA